jgi:hypothetical protein
MVVFTKDNGMMIYLMEKEELYMKMEVNMKGNLHIINVLLFKFLKYIFFISYIYVIIIINKNYYIKLVLIF